MIRKIKRLYLLKRGLNKMHKFLRAISVIISINRFAETETQVNEYSLKK